MWRVAIVGGAQKKFDLGKDDGDITCHISESAKRLLIEFNVDKERAYKDRRQRPHRGIEENAGEDGALTIADSSGRSEASLRPLIT